MEISQYLPKEFEKLLNLKKLEFNDNEEFCNILCDFTNLPNLKCLKLKNTQISKVNCDLLELWALDSMCEVVFE